MTASRLFVLIVVVGLHAVVGRIVSPKKMHSSPKPANVTLLRNRVVAGITLR